MKKLITLLLLSTPCYAGLISHTDYISGGVITSAGQNANENAIFNEFNGNIDDTNIKSAANINTSKLLALTANEIVTTDASGKLQAPGVAVGNGLSINGTGTPVSGASTELNYNSSSLYGTLRSYNETSATLQPFQLFGSSVVIQNVSTIYGLFTSSGVSILGTNTNDNASVGFVGQISSASFSVTQATTTTQYWDMANITLTPGDWDITFIVVGNVSSVANTTQYTAFIGTVAGNNSTGQAIGDNEAQVGVNFATNVTLAIPSYRVSINSTTTYYAKVAVIYSGTIPTLSGRISARRMR